MICELYEHCIAQFYFRFVLFSIILYIRIILYTRIKKD